MNKVLKIRGGTRYDVITFLKGFSIITIVLMHLLQVFMESCPSISEKSRHS